MDDRSKDPFFTQLKADLDEGFAALERGDSVDAEEVWKDYGLAAVPIQRAS
ncbi:MAG: hypothetical protein NVSMB14_15430 [Isosphaeraceae bacterium]